MKIFFIFNTFKKKINIKKKSISLFKYYLNYIKI